MNGQRNAIYSIVGHHNYSIDLKKKKPIYFNIRSHLNFTII